MSAQKEFLLAANRESEEVTATDARVRDTAALPASEGVYNEEAFRYFLDIERRRSRVSGQPFLLLVINLGRAPGEPIPPRVATKVFAALAASLRDTDFVGWYAETRSIGAVLIQAVDPSTVDAVGRVRTRVSKSLERQLPSDVIERLHIRVCQIRSDREAWS